MLPLLALVPLLATTFAGTTPPRLVPEGHRTMLPDGWIALLDDEKPEAWAKAGVHFISGTRETPAKVEALAASPFGALVLVRPAKPLRADGVYQLRRRGPLHPVLVASGILVARTKQLPVAWKGPPRVAALEEPAPGVVAAVVELPVSRGAEFVLVKEAGGEGPAEHALFTVQEGRIRIELHRDWGGFALVRGRRYRFTFELLDRRGRRVRAPGKPLEIDLTALP